MAEIQLDGNVIEKKITQSEDKQEQKVYLNMRANDGSTLELTVIEQLTDVTPKGKRKKIMEFMPIWAVARGHIILKCGDYNLLGEYTAIKPQPGHRDYSYDMGVTQDGRLIEHLEVSTCYDCDKHHKSPTGFTFRAYVK